jgi:hypothetical protein
VASGTSKGGVPLVQTKFRPLSKIDTPAEIKITESQRLGATIEPPLLPVKKEEGGAR